MGKITTILFVGLFLCASLFGQTKREYYEGGANLREDIRGTNWEAQSFTVGTSSANEAFTVTVFNIFGFRTGNPGTITVELYAANGNLPTGSVLSSGTYNGNTLGTSYPGAWIDINMSAFNLQPSTKYIAVIKVLSGSWGNSLNLLFKLGGNLYSGGMWIHTSNSGSSWTENSNDDLNFRIYGTEVNNEEPVSRYYINEDSTYKNLSDVVGLLKSGDTISFHSGDTFRIGGANIVSKNNLVFNTYGGESLAHLTGYFDVSGDFSQNGNVWSKTLSAFSSSEKHTVTFSPTWTTYYWGPVNGLTFLLIDGEKHTVGKYPDSGVINITDTLNYYSTFRASSLNGTFANNYWDGAYANIRTVDWILHKMPIQTYYSNGTFSLRLTPSYWAGTEYLTWHGSQNRVLKFSIINHPNTLSINGEWAINFSSKNLSVFNDENLNLKKVEIPLHDSLFYFNSCTNIKLEYLHLSGGNKFTVGLVNSTATIEDCELSKGYQAVQSIGSNVNYIRSSFTDFTSGGIFTSLNDGDINVNNCYFKRIGIWFDMGNGEISSQGNYAAIKNEYLASGFSLTVSNSKFDSCGYAYYGVVRAGNGYPDTILFKNNLMVNSGGWNLIDCGAAYLYAIRKVAFVGNGVFNSVSDTMYNITQGKWNDIIGIYYDGDSDYGIIDSNTVSGCGWGIKLHGTNNNLVSNNRLSYSDYQEIFITEVGANEATNNCTITYNTLAPKSNSHQGFYFNRYNSAIITPNNNNINFNRHLNWNNSDTGTWLLGSYWSSWHERGIGWMRENYGWETNSTVDNTPYNSLLTFYNWTDNIDTVYINGVGYNESGNSIGDYIILQPYGGALIRFTSFSSLEYPEKYSFYNNGVVVLETEPTSGGGVQPIPAPIYYYKVPAKGFIIVGNRLVYIK